MSEAGMVVAIERPEVRPKFDDLKPDLERQALLRREIAATRAACDAATAKVKRLQAELEQAERAFIERAKKVAEGM